MSFKRKAFYYLLIFVLAVAAQGVMHCRSIQPPRTDAVGYDTLATNLVLGNGYTVDRTHPAVFRGPLYPAFLSVVYRIFGLNNYTAAAAVHLLLIAFSCLLMIVIGEQLGSFRTGVAAAALMAICPTVGDYIPFMLTETFYTFITMGLCLSLVVWTRRQTPAFAALAGGIIGISLLCRLTLQFYAVAAALYLGVFVLKRKKLLQVALFLCMLPAVLFPWTLRNWRAFSTFIPVEKGTLGPVLWLSSLPVEGIHNGSWQTEPLGTLRQQMRDIELDNYFKQRAMRIIRQHPFVYLRVVLGRVPGLWLNADYYAFMGISGKLGNDLIEK
jgi:hypothetical protein